MAASLEFTFVAPVLLAPAGLVRHVVPLPDEVARAFAEAGVRRVVGTLNGVPIRRAIHGSADEAPRLVVGQPLLREAGASYGDMVHVVLRPDPEPERVEVGEELAAVLEQDEAAAARFAAMTPGRQRSLALYVTGAKRAETRLRRALELARKLRTHTLYGDVGSEERRPPDPDADA